jgi:PAS domain S-box-containing protein
MNSSLSLSELENFIGVIPAELVIWDLNHVYLFINRVTVSDESIRNWLIGKTDFEYCKKYNKPISLAENRHFYFNECVKLKSKVEFLEIFETPNGQVHKNRVMSPILNVNGDPVYVIGYSQDDSVKVVQSLELARIKVALDSSKDGIAILNKDGNYTYMNSAHATIFEYDNPSDLNGKHWTSIYTQEESNKIIELYFPLLQKNGYWAGTTKGITKNGKEVYQDINLTSLPDTGLICVTRDITQERVLFAKSNQLAIVAEKTTSFVVIADGNDKFIWANDSFYNSTGYSEEDLKDNTFLTTIYDINKNEIDIDHILKTVKSSGEFNGKICMALKNTSPFWILINITAIFDKEGLIQNLVYLQLDINNLHELESKLSNAVLQEKNLNLIKSKFLKMTSHEIRTPLTNINLYLDLIRIKKTDSVRGSELLDKMHIQIKVLTDILDNFILLSKSEEDNIKAVLDDTNIDDLIDKFINSNYTNHIQNKINYKITGQPKTILLDKILFKVVFKNLLENAAKFSSSETDIDICLDFHDDHVLLSITDYGLGIPLLEQKMVFDSFFRASNAEYTSGTGIGLIIVKEFVHLQNGTIWFESEENQKTTFYIKFLIYDKNTTT